MKKTDFDLLKLLALKEFQGKYPTSHVGGSIGLMLRGIDLKRDLLTSDLDITIDEYNFNENTIEGIQQRSDSNDFDYAIKKVYGNGANYVKIDIRVSPEPSFDIVEFNGINYNVSKLRDILFWKKKYANKGFQKHVNDLIAIETGIRPIDIITQPSEIDDLPF